MTNIYKLYIICFLHTAVALKGEDTYSENSEVAAAPSQCLKASSALCHLYCKAFDTVFTLQFQLWVEGGALFFCLSTLTTESFFYSTSVAEAFLLLQWGSLKQLQKRSHELCAESLFLWSSHGIGCFCEMHISVTEMTKESAASLLLV